MPGCAVFHCHNNTSKKVPGIRFFRFPKDEEMRRRWAIACQRDDSFNSDKATICSIHFSDKQREKSLMNTLLETSPKRLRNLKRDAVPILHLPKKSTNASKVSDRIERFNTKARKRYVDSILDSEKCLSKRLKVTEDPGNSSSPSLSHSQVRAKLFKSHSSATSVSIPESSYQNSYEGPSSSSVSSSSHQNLSGSTVPLSMEVNFPASTEASVPADNFCNVAEKSWPSTEAPPASREVSAAEHDCSVAESSESCHSTEAQIDSSVGNAEFGNKAADSPVGNAESASKAADSPIGNAESAKKSADSPLGTAESVNKSAGSPLGNVESANESASIPELETLKSLSKENYKLAEKVRKLQNEVKFLKSELKRKCSDDRCKEILSRHFSPGVVSKLIAPDPSKRIIWNPEDIASAISLRAISMRSYKYLRSVMKIPLPSPSCLKKWARKLDLTPGILKAVVKLLEKKAANMTDAERICVISFDEMSLDQSVCFDKGNEQVIGPHKKVQTVFVRGLLSSWKQVIYYSYDTRMTKTLLCSLIKTLRNIGLRVVSATCDGAGENRQLRTDLGVTSHKPYFYPDSNSSDKVFFFYDAPHLLKLIRNHFIDEGFAVNGQSVSKRCLVQLLDHLTYVEPKQKAKAKDNEVSEEKNSPKDSSEDLTNVEPENKKKGKELSKKKIPPEDGPKDLTNVEPKHKGEGDDKKVTTERNLPNDPKDPDKLDEPAREDFQIAFKLSEDMLYMSNLKRQNVQKAAKLFSHTNAKALKYYYDQGVIDDESCEAVIYLLDLINRWFDLFNSVDKFGSYCGSDEQKKFLNEVSNYIKNLRTLNKNVDKPDQHLLPFQEGFLLSNNALMGLLPYLQEILPNKKIDYIITRRLNQDVIEHFFGIIRGMFMFYDTPDPLDFRSRLRWYLLGKNPTLCTDEALKVTQIETNISASLNAPTVQPSGSQETIENRIKTPELFDDMIGSKPLTQNLLGHMFNDGEAKKSWIEEFEANKEWKKVNEESLAPKTFELPKFTSKTYKEGRIYLAGFVAYKFRKQCPELGSYTSKTSVAKKVVNEGAKKDIGNEAEEETGKKNGDQIAKEAEEEIGGKNGEKTEEAEKETGEKTRDEIDKNAEEETEKEAEGTWLECVSKGYLMNPSNDLKDAVKKADEEFLKFHGPKELNKGRKIFQHVLQKTKERLAKPIKISDKVLLLYIRSRTYFRLRNWNLQLRRKVDPEPDSSAKKKSKKKLGKFQKKSVDAKPRSSNTVAKKSKQKSVKSNKKVNSKRISSTRAQGKKKALNPESGVNMLPFPAEAPKIKKSVKKFPAKTGNLKSASSASTEVAKQQVSHSKVSVCMKKGFSVDGSDVEPWVKRRLAKLGVGTTPTVNQKNRGSTISTNTMKNLSLQQHRMQPK